MCVNWHFSAQKSQSHHRRCLCQGNSESARFSIDHNSIASADAHKTVFSFCENLSATRRPRIFGKKDQEQWQGCMDVAKCLNLCFLQFCYLFPLTKTPVVCPHDFLVQGQRVVKWLLIFGGFLLIFIISLEIRFVYLSGRCCSNNKNDNVQWCQLCFESISNFGIFTRKKKWQKEVFTSYIIQQSEFRGAFPSFLPPWHVGILWVWKHGGVPCGQTQKDLPNYNRCAHDRILHVKFRSKTPTFVF